MCRTTTGPAIVGVVVFTSTALLTYVASAAFHGSRAGASKRWWEQADHCAIHALIADTYTLFALVLQSSRLWLLLSGIWALAAAGIVHEWRAAAGGPSAERRSSVTRYMAAGWLGVVAAAPIAAELQRASLAWLRGGAALTRQAPAFSATARSAHAHGVWHLFVLAGTGCH